MYSFFLPSIFLPASLLTFIPPTQHRWPDIWIFLCQGKAVIQDQKWKILKGILPSYKWWGRGKPFDLRESELPDPRKETKALEVALSGGSPFPVGAPER